MHESAHVWQHQHGVFVQLRALNRRYDYSLSSSQSWKSYGIEQQGDIVMDYYLKLQGSGPANYSFNDYRRVLPFRGAAMGKMCTGSECDWQF